MNIGKSFIWCVMIGCLVLTGAVQAQTTPKPVPIKELHSRLTKEGTQVLTDKMIRRLPRLHAILKTNPGDTVSEALLVEKLKEHFKAHRSVFHSMDMDGDGYVSHQEMRVRATEMLVYFPYLDTNQDGRISRQEFINGKVFFTFLLQSKKSGYAGSVVSFVAPQKTVSEILTSAPTEELLDPSRTTVFDSIVAFQAHEERALHEFFSKVSKKSHRQPEEEEPEHIIVVATHLFDDDDFYIDLSDFGYSTGIAWGAVLCRAACWAAGAAICAGVSVGCAAGTGITVGGLAIPCSVAIPAACAGATAAASLCSELC